MRILLIFPPQGHFTQPFLALPSLRAYLEQEGYDDVHTMDANIEAYDWMLSRERLQRSYDRIVESGRLDRLESMSQLKYTDMVEYRRLSQVKAAGEWAIENIEDAKATMRNRELFYDRERYMRAGRCIEQGLSMISAEHHPTDLSAHGFSMRYSVQVSDDIFAGAVDENENPYLEFFREVTMPQIQALNPDVIGFSLTFTSQAVPLVSLASMIKAWKPETHIAVGGGLVAYIGEKLMHRPDLFDTVDTLIRLEGERPLTEILHNIETGGGADGLAKIPNILYRDDAGAVRQTWEQEPLKIDSLPTPNFEGLPLDQYFSPEFVVPLAITRGCYWGKCVFCTLHKVIGPGYRGRSIEKVVEDIRYLKERWGTRHFYFPIEDLPPNMVRKLPQALLDAGIDIDWWCDAKLEPEVFTDETCEMMAEAGCKRLAFGYESASARVLDLMCKGSEPGPGLDVIKRVHIAGISVTLYVMVGFPTETEEEARLTLDTLLENREHFEEVSIRVYYLDDMSDIFQTPERYKISEIYPDDRADLQVYYDFRADEGMSRNQARQVYLDMLEKLESNLPVFQNRNVLYHELKSHYFLHLVAAGGVENLMSGSFATGGNGANGNGHGAGNGAGNGNGHGANGQTNGHAADSTDPALPAKPRHAGLRFLDTRFDRDEVDRAIERAQDSLCLPRYQFDLISGETAERLDAEVPRLEANEGVIALNPGTGDLHHLSPDAADLLRACDGESSLDAILERYDEEHRPAAAEFLRELAGAGLVQTTEEEVTA